MKIRRKYFHVMVQFAGITAIGATTTINPDGFSTAVELPANSASVSVGGDNLTTVGNWGNGAPGGNLLVGTGNHAAISDSVLMSGIWNGISNQEGSVVLGFFNNANFSGTDVGQANFIFGYSNTISPGIMYGVMGGTWGSLVLGNENQTDQSDSWIFGRGNIGQNETVTLGTYAATVADASLIVGKGTGWNARSNGLVVFKNGLVDVPGMLTIGGSPALTQSNIAPIILDQNFVDQEFLESNKYLKKSIGSGATASANSYLAWGNGASAGWESIAIGFNAKANTNNSIALGQDSMAQNPYSTALQGGVADGVNSFAANWGVASGELSLGLAGGWATGPAAVAIGGFDELSWWINEAGAKGAVAIGGATNGAWGECSYAFGCNSAAFGRHSYSIGYSTRTSGYAVSMGSQNLTANNQMSNMHNTMWIENGALFELGNGRPNDQGGDNEFSNAITTLKNGQTTLTNKAWKANTGSPLADPTPATDSNGEALVVEGHTRLKGKVVIEQPQGDISMGIYGGN